MSDLLVVGLGNPGTAYRNTRHNVGFQTLDYLADRFTLRFRKKKNYHYARHKMQEGTLFLCKPHTYMNLSGDIFPSVLQISGLSIEQLIVVVDNFDIPTGELRLKRGGGHPSHNGLGSINNALGKNSYTRLYLGIGKKVPVVSHVLGRWTVEEEDAYHRMFLKACDVLVALLSQSIESVMGVYNKRFTDTSC